MRSGGGILSIAGAINPETLTGLVLDPKIVADRDQFGIAFPPFAEDTLWPIGTLTRRRTPRHVKLTGG